MRIVKVLFLHDGKNNNLIRRGVQWSEISERLGAKADIQLLIIILIVMIIIMMHLLFDSKKSYH